MAGKSARATAADKRRRGQALLVEADKYDRGADGEEATARALAALPPDSWTVIDDVHWPGRPQANIDHVVIGPSGIYVIDSKKWAATVRVANGVLHRDGRPVQKTVDSASSAALAVAALVPQLDPRMVRAVLCFATETKVSGKSYDVGVCSTANIASVLLMQRQVLAPDVRRFLAQDLDAQLWPATSPAPTISAMPAPAPALAPRTNRQSKRQSRRAGGALRRLVGVAAAVALVLFAANGGAAVVADALTPLLTQR